MLSTGKNSRLYKKLIYEQQSASSANAFQASSEIASTYVVQVNAKPGNDIYEMETTVLALLDEFIQKGPTPEEMNRAKASYFSRFIKGMERIGGVACQSLNIQTHNLRLTGLNYQRLVLR